MSTVPDCTKSVQPALFHVIKFYSRPHTLNMNKCIFYNEQHIEGYSKSANNFPCPQTHLKNEQCLICCKTYRTSRVLFCTVSCCLIVTITKVRRILLLELSENTSNTGCVYHVFSSVDFSDEYWRFKRSQITAQILLYYISVGVSISYCLFGHKL